MADTPALIEVARYPRALPVGIARVWENVFDWEHLPWLHQDSFLDIERIDSGPWGWRARVGLPPAERRSEIEIELLVERAEHRYVTRTTAGPGAGSEIWTRLMPRGEEATDIEVRFLLPDVTPEQGTAVGAALVALYTRLWDEDEAMMVRRRDALGSPAARASDPARLDLGPLDSLRPRLPLQIELGGAGYRVIDVDGELVAHATACPHMLGPLGAAPVEAGVVRCPWHGYRFALKDGRCLDAARYRLPRARVRVDPETGHVEVGVDG